MFGTFGQVARVFLYKGNRLFQQPIEVWGFGCGKQEH